MPHSPSIYLSAPRHAHAYIIVRARMIYVSAHVAPNAPLASRSHHASSRWLFAGNVYRRGLARAHTHRSANEHACPDGQRGEILANHEHHAPVGNVHLERPDSIVLAAAAFDDVNKLRVKSSLFEGEDSCLQMGPLSLLWRALYGEDEEGGVMAMSKEIAARLQLEEELSNCIHTPYMPTARLEKLPAKSSALTRVALLAPEPEVGWRRGHGVGAGRNGCRRALMS